MMHASQAPAFTHKHFVFIFFFKTYINYAVTIALNLYLCYHYPHSTMNTQI